MKDKITLDRIQLLHPKLRDEVTDAYNEIYNALTGTYTCRFTHTFRTFAEQDELYAKGRSKPGNIVTNAKGGFSYHNYGLAIDIVLVNKSTGAAVWDVKVDSDKDSISDWIEIVNILKQFGFEWGGDWKFKDYPHFQKTFNYSIRQLYNLNVTKKVDKNGYVLI